MEYDLVSTPTQETVQLVADFLSNLTKQNDNLPTVHLTRFHARTIPAIDIHGYLTRILRYAPCGNEAFLAVLVYLDRMSNPDTYLSTPQFATSTIISLRDARDPSGSGKRLPIVINSYNIHRLLICGIMVAVKFLSDIFYTNSHIARVGGLPVNELNQLEIEFLLLNDFNLTVEVEELQR
ncbi:cyclin-domain-containing protein, partial [Polychytrium aggregatum]|uniref:cyclin-domain-containing protein n=1 Tax=Polychytrium aggregatum TaxID=110093 RepID=UPI0022FE1C1B